MAFINDNTITDINSALFPGPAKNNALLNSAFGGESVGFAKGVDANYSGQFYTNSAEPSAESVPAGMGTTKLANSLANSYALFNFQGFHGNLTKSQQSNYTDSPNNPLMGGTGASNVNVPKIIEYFGEHYPDIQYKPADFLYSKYYKKIPVNHLITLRRFSFPTTDNIYNYSTSSATGKNGDDVANPNVKGGTTKIVDSTQLAGVTAITYLGESSGNKLSDLLKFSYGLKWQTIKSKIEEVDTGGAGGGYTNQPFYSKLGSIGKGGLDALKGNTASDSFRARNGAGSSTADKLGTTYANFVLGPINVVNETMIREAGISFSNDITLTFEYELKSLSYINPKIAMLDVISNMLTMSTNNAQFFGGGHRYYGSAGYAGSQFGDISKLRGGDFSGYMGSVISDVSTGAESLFGNSDGGFDVASVVKGGLKAGKAMLGNLLGGFLSSQVGGATGTQATKALISGEPTGQWHVTIGNPLNPILMMGNMVCDNTVMTLGSGLGYDDFPVEVKFDVDLKHGKPRDRGDIENMFNAGQGRLYATAQDVDVLNFGDVATYGNVPLPGVAAAGLSESANRPTAAQVNPNEGSKKSTKAANESVAAAYVTSVSDMLLS
jgi:hypothetical protein|tara:strand:+ start:2389 stop:4209 length:1821 start_codon:yes stop_codon:yes gene_type:complete